MPFISSGLIEDDYSLFKQCLGSRSNVTDPLSCHTVTNTAGVIRLQCITDLKCTVNGMLAKTNSIRSNKWVLSFEAGLIIPLLHWCCCSFHLDTWTCILSQFVQYILTALMDEEFLNVSLWHVMLLSDQSISNKGYIVVLISRLLWLKTKVYIETGYCPVPALALLVYSFTHIKK